MTAGRGVVHAVMPMSEEPVVGLQLWVNLLRRYKMVEPAYQELKCREVPKPSRGGVTVAVISGEALGGEGPDEEQQRIEPHHTVVFGNGDSVKFGNKGSEVSHFVLIAGEPIKEPVIQQGPFVMTTEEEIRQAIRDYETGSNGFEKAINRRSKFRDSIGIERCSRVVVVAADEKDFFHK